MSNLMTASREWAYRPADQRFQTLDALHAAVAARRNRSRSSDVSLDSLEATATADGNGIELNHGIVPSMPTNWAFGQLAGWLKAPAEYLRRLPTELAVRNLNHGIKNADRDTLKLMTVTSADGENNFLQAVTSPTYGRIWDADVTHSVRNIVERTGGRFYNPKAYDPHTGQVVPSGLYASDRDCFMFMIDGGSLLDIGPRAQLNRGFIAGNSETGARVAFLIKFLFNKCCGNHIIYGVQDLSELRIRHTSGGPGRFNDQAIPQLLEYVNASARPVEDVIAKAQSMLLPSDDKELLAWFQARKFTKTEALQTIATARKEEGDCRSLWQAVQGATAYARGFDFIDARLEMESKAGELMKLASATAAM